MIFDYSIDDLYEISLVMTVRLFIKRDVSGSDSRYGVWDEKGAEKYRVIGRNTPSGESVRIKDNAGAAVCKIRRLGFSTLSAYTVKVGHETVRLNIALSGGVPSVRFHGISFIVRGDVCAGNYDILDADHTVVCVVSKDFAKRTLTLTVNMEERELFCIAAAICVDSLSLSTAPVLQTV